MAEEPDWLQFNGRTIESVEANDFHELEIYFVDGSKATIGTDQEWGDFYVEWENKND